MIGVAIPPVVVELAKQSNGSPISWNVQAAQVVIVFEDGRKLTFERTADKVEVVKTEKVKEKK
jgi:hypothetical protein